MRVKYSFVIATLNDEGELLPCLESLAAMLPAAGFEVIVVDQNPDDRLQPLLALFKQRLQLVHLKADFQNASRARNLGASVAQGQWLAFPDDDCQPLPDVLRVLEGLTANSRYAVISGQTVNMQGQANIVGWRPLAAVFDTWTMFRSFCEATLFIRREVFLGVAGFDVRFGPGARFPAAEGADLLCRVFDGDPQWLAYYDPAIKVYHPSKIPPWNAWAVKRLYAYSKGDGAFAAKQLRWPVLWWAGKAFAVSVVRVLMLQKWRSVAHVCRLAGLVVGFFTYLLVAMKVMK